MTLQTFLYDAASEAGAPHAGPAEKTVFWLAKKFYDLNLNATSLPERLSTFFQQDFFDRDIMLDFLQRPVDLVMGDAAKLRLKSIIEQEAACIGKSKKYLMN
ncbi:MAG: hypothetical protein ACP5M0_07205 [Desulfomonilaceae bacterium]